MALIFDSLSTARMLESKGFTAEQAEGIAEQMNQLLTQDIATKPDLTALRAATQADIQAVRGEVAALRTELKGDIEVVRGEMATMRTELKGDIATLRSQMTSLGSELTVKIYTVGLAVVALVVAAQKMLG